MLNLSLANFTGPIDALLHLVEEKKMPIHEISLVAVTDSFLQYVRTYTAQRPKVSDVTYYLIVAATLVLMKSRALLPNVPLSVEEEQSIDELELQLKLLKVFKTGAKHLMAQWGARMLFLRSRCVAVPVFAPDVRITPQFLQASFQNALKEIPQVKELPKQTLEQVVHLHDVMDAIHEKITTGTTFTFLDFTTHLLHRFADRMPTRAQKSAVVISFLAILEMVKNGAVSAEQNGDSITIAPIEVPRV